MAMQLAAPLLPRASSPRRIGPEWHLPKLLALASLIFCCSNLALAQLPQPLVFSSGGAVVLRNDQTGSLTPVTGSPFNSAGQNLTVDVQGRFLFSPGTDSIHMYHVTDATTGAYQEVPHSPFSSSNTKSPAFIAVEPTGQYIAVVNLVGQLPGESLVETFKIDASAPALIPVSFVELVSRPVAAGFAQPPNAQEFFIYMGPNPSSSNVVIHNGEDFERVTIDPQTGNLLGIQNLPDTSTGRSFAMDPQGRFVLIGHGQMQGRIDLQSITPNFPNGSFLVSQNLFPGQLFVDSTGAFVYATFEPDPSNKVHILAINPATSAMTETPSSPLPGAIGVPLFFPDPTGPYQYGDGAQPNQLRGFSVDPQTGYFVEISGSPFTVAGSGSLTFSIPPGQQGVSGPSISLSANSLSFPSQQTNSPSQPQMLTITSNGQQALSLNTVALGGPDAADFLESDTCHAPNLLQPKTFCSASVTFKPLTPGPKQANLAITDDAPGSPHSVPLTGTAVAPPPPAPAVTISPNPASFPTITQGTTSGNPISITVTNSGGATLHISTVTVAGNNSSEFSNSMAACSTAVIAPNGSCSVSVTFAPLTVGPHSETISLADDAPGPPQMIQVNGNAIPAVVVGPAPSGSTSASVNAGATAQYQLLLTPGTGFTGSVTFTCTGVPLGAVCQAPSLMVSGNNAMPFMISVTTSGPAHALLFPRSPTGIPTGKLPAPLFLLLFATLFCLLIVPLVRATPQRRLLQRRSAFASASLLFLALFAASGCGGGTGYQSGAVTPPPPVITPQGSSTLTVTPSATNSAGKPLQLSPIQLSLTVN